MESIGEKLRAARESRGATHDQIARETNIAKRYLEALEAEDFTVFPGEPYILGFLRNYAEHLGLRGEELVGIYRNMKIQEQPVPVNELVARAPVLPPLAVAGIVAGGLALVAIALVLAFVRPGSRGGDAGQGAERPKSEYALGTGILEKRLYPGDSIIVDLRDEKYKLSLAKISDAVFLDTPSGQLRFALGEEFGIDLDSDNQGDVRGAVSDFVKGDEKKGAMLRLALAEAWKDPSAPASGQAASAGPSATAGDQGLAVAPGASSAPQASAATGQASAAAGPAGDLSKGQVLFESRTSPYPFTMSVTFRQYCMFRHEVDRKERTERYYRKSEQVAANANNGIKIWLSNASSCVVQVIGGGKTVNVELGRPGEVVVKNIKWVQTDSGGWVLASLPVD
jgi:cytoskeletal protein RodZ